LTQKLDPCFFGSLQNEKSLFLEVIKPCSVQNFAFSTELYFAFYPSNAKQINAILLFYFFIDCFVRSSYSDLSVTRMELKHQRLMG